MADELDPKVSERYRELRAEEPPRELDQAILAAAHRATDRAHAPLVAPAGRHRWYLAFGALAVLVLAVAITVQLDRTQLDSEALTAPSAPPVSEERKERERFSGEPGVLADQARAPQAPAAERAKKPAPAPAPAKPEAAGNAAPPQAAEVARVDRLESRREQSLAAEAPAAQPEKKEQAAPAPATAPAQRALAGAVAVSPQQLLERIAELRKQGRHDEADKALAEFRKQYPDYRISEEMLRKVERGN